MNSNKTWIATFWRVSPQPKNRSYYTGNESREFQAMSREDAERQAEEYTKNAVYSVLGLVRVELKQKKISIKSKRAQNWLAAYNASKCLCVEQAYINPPSEKIKADKECWQRCQQEDGRRFRIISAGRPYFTAAWTVRDGLRVETAYNSYFIEL